MFPKLKGLNLKVKLKLKLKLKLKCFEGVRRAYVRFPGGWYSKGRVVFNRLPRVRDRRFWTEGYSSSSQSRRVRDLTKERLKEGCSSGS